MSLFEKLAAQESSFKESQFLSPVVRGHQIRVRIAGIVMSLTVAEPARFRGWGVFQPISYREAKLVREPSMAERSAYLNLFPAVRLVAENRKRGKWFGIPATQADARFGFTDVVPIELAEGVEQFDTVLTRFDGQRCWFDRKDPRRSVRIAQALRESLRDMAELAALEVAECNSAEREAYERALLRKMMLEKDADEIRIQQALARVGAKYQSHREVGDCFSVTYEVNGEAHRSTVDKNSLSIQSAGICLAGTDAAFDLQSLVSVIEEGQRTGQINHE